MSMKRLSILAGAGCAAVLFTVFCTKVEFDNPLDPKGTNYLYKDTTDEKRKISNYDKNPECAGAGLFCDPELSCDKKLPEIWLVDANNKKIANDTVYLDWWDGVGPEPGLDVKSENEFQRLMGKGDIWTGVVGFDNGHGKTTGLKIGAFLSQNGADSLKGYNGAPGIPQFDNGSKYLIIYTAEKELCPGETVKPRAQTTRIIIPRKYVASDTVLPTIELNDPKNYSFKVGQPFNDPGASATDGRGAALSVTVISNNVDNTRHGTYQVIYQACKKLKYADGIRPDKDTCVRITRSVLVEDTTVVAKPAAVIVLKRYQYSDITGGPYNLVDTSYAQPVGFTFHEPGQRTAAPGSAASGVQEVFYISRTGAKVTVTPMPTVTRTAGTMSGGMTTYTYKVDGTNDYEAAIALRNAYMTERNACNQEAQGRPSDDPFSMSPPTINMRNAASGGTTGQGTPAYNEISGNATWNYDRSWTVTKRDDSVYESFKLGIDFGTLNWGYPQAGTYTITYVAQGGCAGYTVQTRSITVK